MEKPESNVDFGYLLDVADGNDEFFLNMLRIIAKSLVEYPPKIKSIFEADDMVQLKDIGHKYKSSLAYIQHPQIVKALNLLESMDTTPLPAELVAQLVTQVLEQSEQILALVQAKIEECEN